MGWVSAGDIFDPVAQALIDLGASSETKAKVLGVLIDQLREGDWDTEDESLRRFRKDQTIVELFYARGVGNIIETTHPTNWSPSGCIEMDTDPASWILRCKGTESCDAVVGRAEATAAGHDSLVRKWAVHDWEMHGGTGRTADWMLIGS